MLGVKIHGEANVWQIITAFTAVIGVIAMIGGGYWVLFKFNQQGLDLQRDLAALTKKVDEGQIAQTKATADASTANAKALGDASTAQAKALADQAADLARQINGVSTAQARTDGKIDGLQALSGRLDRLSDKVDRVADDRKSGDDDFKIYQADADKRINGIDTRVKVLECIRGGKC